jgi:anti-anti-sigma factor
VSEVLFNKEDDILVVELVGEINILDVNDFKDSIKEKINSEQSKKIIVDMAKVPFMDSSGLGMLISLYKYVNENQGKIVYTGLSDYILKILGFAKLDKIFIISEDIEGAKAAL